MLIDWSHSYKALALPYTSVWPYQNVSVTIPGPDRPGAIPWYTWPEHAPVLKQGPVLECTLTHTHNTPCAREI